MVDRDYLRHAINYSLWAIILQAHGGAGLAHITKGRFEEIAIPLPPLAQQMPIGRTIDELFEELDEANSALTRAREGLEPFRASLLHAACTGALSADWREANPPAETGESLLRRILAKRCAAWERTERARLRAKGTPPRGTRGRRAMWSRQRPIRLICPICRGGGPSLLLKPLDRCSSDDSAPQSIIQVPICGHICVWPTSSKIASIFLM